MYYNIKKIKFKMLNKIIKSLVIMTIIGIIIILFGVFKSNKNEKIEDIINDTCKVDTIIVDSIAK